MKTLKNKLNSAFEYFPQVEKVSTIYKNIAANKMLDLPIYNQNLKVETIGFTSWQDNLVGILITPWMMNLLIIADEKPLSPIPDNKNQAWFFPSGKYDFMGHNLEGFGWIHSCSLISPMDDFNNQAEAIEVADNIIGQLFYSSEAEQVSASRRKFFGLSSSKL